MRFSNVSEFELAKIFVHAKKEKIEKLLGVKNLDTYTTAEIIYIFLKKQSADFWNDYPNKYDALFDDVFFCVIIGELQKQKRRGKKFDGDLRFSEPNITYVS